MKDLRQMYLQIAAALEKGWTSRKDKSAAAIFLRNAASDIAHCYFCGLPAQMFDGEVHESRFHPQANICRFCVKHIAQGFGLRFAGEPHFRSITYTWHSDHHLFEGRTGTC